MSTIISRHRLVQLLCIFLLLTLIHIANYDSYTSVASTTSRSQKDHGLPLMKKNCYVCHNPSAKSHDELMAPPLAMVKFRYQRVYKDRDAFVAAVTAFVTAPQRDKAILSGAVNQFGLMPQMQFDEKTVKEIAAYIYENSIEEPAWFNGNGLQSSSK